MPEGHTPFAIFNKVGNPGIALLLRSPLHGLAGGSLALITVTGRKSGKEYRFPIAYAREGGVVTIEVGWPERKVWWRNLTGDGAPVAMRIKGTDYTGRAVARGEASEGVTVTVDLDG